MILAIDPGPTQSAFCFIGAFDKTPGEFEIVRNDDLLGIIRENNAEISVIAIEWIECMGMAVGKETFETVYWIGRFSQLVDGQIERVTRRQVKLHLCGNMRAKDANIRQALIDKYGGSKAAAIGTKKAPGPLHGIRSHIWSALAVGVTYLETRAKT